MGEFISQVMIDLKTNLFFDKHFIFSSIEFKKRHKDIESDINLNKDSLALEKSN